MNKTITVDGVEYVRADQTSIDRTGSPVRILIGQRGWVWVGYYTEDGEKVKLSGARNIRRWGTTAGLGELVDGPLDDTVLDPAGDVEMHELAVVATIGADVDAWKAHLG